MLPFAIAAKKEQAKQQARYIITNQMRTYFCKYIIEYIILPPGELEMHRLRLQKPER